MYVGDYLSSNLGHEVINLFQDDKGRHYLYLNQSGSLSAEHKDHDVMLLVRYEGTNRFEIVGMAKGLHPAKGITDRRSRELSTEESTICEAQKQYINDEGGILYDGHSIIDIFGDAGQQNVFLTFRADTVRIPKDEIRIFLEYDPSHRDRREGNKVFVVMEDHNLPKTSLKSYITPMARDKEGNEFYSRDCQKIIDMIVNDDSLWADKKDWKVNSENEEAQTPVSLFNICEIENDENRLTNAMAYFMRQPEYRALWQKFFKEKTGIELQDNYKVERERDISHVSPLENGEKITGRIDLFITDDKSIVVIENKIKSDINTNRTDKIDETQLDRYQKYVDAIDKKNERDHRFFILAPNYNKPHISEKMDKLYDKLTYLDIYEFLNRDDNREIVESDPNFRAFRDVIHRHTLTNPNGYLYHEMMQKFYARLKELKLKQKKY